ncbi:MAG: Penicillin-binding protein 4* [Chlamydiia bacterium]|nr:Penicillin-binding protein 4* [Chlamydiia bacterium]MCH9618310.1 Penicillin-binding protein 4* [Chlamydiia bacterium]MCH9624183.1 Penicillin-binding protein 4* [Chlamydiia bacterium]
MFKHLSICAILLCSSFTFAAEKVNITTEQLEQVLNSAQECKTNGCLLVAQDNRIILEKGSGYADIEKNILNTTDSQFAVGSITKQFTAAGLLRCFYDKVQAENPSYTENQLITEVKQLVQKPISYFLEKEDPIWDANPPKWLDRITIHHLLTHTSGLYNYTASEECHSFINNPPSRAKEVVKIFSSKDLSFEPGEQYEYCNTGYFLVGLIIEKESGKSLGNYLKETFFGPLNMKSTFLPSKGNIATLEKEFPNLAKGHFYDLAEKDKAIYVSSYSEDMVYLQGCGALISTVADLYKWNQNLHVNKTVLSDGLLCMMTTPYQQIADGAHYGYGLVILNNAIWHNGMIAGYSAELYYYPQLNVTSVSLNNTTFPFDQISAIFKEAQENTDSNEAMHEYLLKHYPLFFANDYYKECSDIQLFLQEKCASSTPS